MKKNFDLEKMFINYYKYKINYINGIPNFEFQKSILDNTALIHPVQSLTISNSPRIIIANNENVNLDLLLYKQILNSDINLI